jgi:hypothetical protein
VEEHLSDKTKFLFFYLINNSKAHFSRYIYFYLTHLIFNNNFEEAETITNEIDYIGSTLLISQGKSWVESKEFKKFNEVFSCKDYNHLIGEFFFLISNIYSSQDEFEKSNFFLNLSIFLNPKFIFNLSLIVENLYLNENYKKAKEVLINFENEEDFYYWYRIKKESHIVSKTKNQDEGLDYIISKFKKIKNPNNKFIFDVANYYKNSKRYNEAIKYYSEIIDSLDENLLLKSDLLYRRGGSYERLKDYENADKDLLHSLKINPDKCLCFKLSSLFMA